MDADGKNHQKAPVVAGAIPTLYNDTKSRTERKNPMLEWTYGNYSFDADLQLIHADVKIAWNGNVWVEEPLCVDVGLPALLASLDRDVRPDRFADPSKDWLLMPFLVCGCGDPECRAFSFEVEHISSGEVKLSLLEERPGRPPRELEQAVVPLADYRAAVLRTASDYLKFVETLPYEPLLRDAEKLVREMAGKLNAERKR
jgi:hypothetical protein